MPDFVNSVPPTITGSRVVGGTINASVGTWTPTPTSYTYQWERADDTSGLNDTVIPGATGATYTIDPSDTNKFLRVGVYPFAPDTAPGWVPAPPSGYTTTGAVTYSTIDAGPIGGAVPGYALFFPTSQHVVQNQNGIFAVYNSTGEESSAVAAYWRLRKSTSVDGNGKFSGATWSTVYDSQSQSQTSSHKAPGLETDKDGNIYVLVSGYAIVANWKMYKFVPPTYSLAPGFPKSLTPGPIPAGKYSVHFDQGRQWMWISIWSANTGIANVGAYDLNGNLMVQKVFWGPKTGADVVHGDAHYNQVVVAKDGTVFVTWNANSTDYPAFGGGTLPHSYYDIFMVYSTDGGNTWIGAAGTPITTYPIGQSDDLAAARSGFQIVNTADSNEFITWNSMTPTSYNWNEITSTVYNGGYLHTYYSTFGVAAPTLHNPWARFNVSTKSVDLRNSPLFKAKTSESDATLVQMNFGGGGTFANDTSHAGRVYFINEGVGPNVGKIMVFRTDDNGTNWYRYALGAAIGGTNLAFTNTCRWIQTDGSIIGSTYVGSDQSIRFFRVTPN